MGGSLWAYTIAKNEGHNVEGWKESLGDLPCFVLDTGSSDDTRQRLDENGIDWSEAYFDPWRFDTALNTALACVPIEAAWVVRVDMDERLTDVDVLREMATTAEFLEADMVGIGQRYSPEVTLLNRRLHRRSGLMWRGATHEVLVSASGTDPFWMDRWAPGEPVMLDQVEGPQVHRALRDDIPALTIAHKEDPDEPRWLYYLGREYYARGDFEKATDLLSEHVGRSNHAAERNDALLLLARMCNDPTEASDYAMRAVGNNPHFREAWQFLATRWPHAAGPFLAAAEAANDSGVLFVRQSQGSPSQQ
jgi:tetratricopeptide (TPR) repeat protein